MILFIILLLFQTPHFTQATVYHAVSSQTDSTPCITSSGYTISDPQNPPRIAAVPRNMIYNGTLAYGDLVIIRCGGCEVEGTYEIQDIMNNRYSWCSVIDLLVPPHVYGKWDITYKLIRR
jgi:hypothetical protein